MFVFPNTNACPWAGLGYVPGPVHLHQRHDERAGDDPRARAQLRPEPQQRGQLRGQRDPGDDRGDGRRARRRATPTRSRRWATTPCATTTASHLGELGWLTSAEKASRARATAYTITPYFGGTGLKLVRVPRGDGSFFDLDVRTTYGAFDTFARRLGGRRPA